MINKSLILFIIFFALSFKGGAQNDSIAKDSVKVANKNKRAVYSNAKKATIMSMLLPGLGQVYNKKVWKVPIIYAGIGGFGYMFLKNNEQYTYYRKNLLAMYDSDSSTVNTTIYSADQLVIQKNGYKKNRDLAFIGVAVFYLLNIIDANVDGHLKTFDVSDDLSIHIDPWQTINVSQNGFGNCVTGLSIKLNFK